GQVLSAPRVVPVPGDDYDTLPVVVVDVDEELVVAFGDPRVPRVVAQNPGAFEDPGVHRHDRRRVLRPNLTQVDGRAVTEQHVSGAVRCAHPDHSLGSYGSSPCSGKTARRVARMA